MHDDEASEAPHPPTSPAGARLSIEPLEGDRFRLSEASTWPWWLFMVIGFAVATVAFRDGWPSLAGDDGQQRRDRIATMPLEEVKALLERELEQNLPYMWSDGTPDARTEAEQRVDLIRCHSFTEHFRPGTLNDALARAYVDAPQWATAFDARWRQLAVAACMGEKRPLNAIP